MGKIIYPGAKADNRAAGTLLADGQEVANTMQCCHCGAHWIWVHGSGKIRPFCMACGGFTCGVEHCMRATAKEHIPWLKRLELHNKDPKKYPLP